ncbi:uncharacterized protein LOC142609180 [Castanea sativa]|uniref:uncharacterized protein LOC142609180 n=1 Tax=Castanea sativa TaxID=21020 RepID=UPI003F64BCF8
MSLLIPGPNQPRNELDVFLRPLVDELKELWEDGAHTYDAPCGYHACYTCNDEPYSEKMESKIGYTNHQAYLPIDHPRRRSWSFNGKIEKWMRSLELLMEKINEQLDRMPNMILGKDLNNKKKRPIIGEPNWSKGKHLDGSFDKPRVFFSLYPEEIDGFYEFLKSVKYPDGYAANISRSVTTRNGRLLNLKSHDCHVLLQRILPIGMQGFANKDICTVLFELGSFFQDLCSRTLRKSDLEKLKGRILLILSQFKKYFPPTFFDVMVHLTIHLPREAILKGPVQYRWMYPIERFLGMLKRFVSNRARPEGSIAKAYILKECINFSSLYLDGAETVHNGRESNADCGEYGPGLIFSQTARPTGSKQDNAGMSRELRDIAKCVNGTILVIRLVEGERYELRHIAQVSMCKVNGIKMILSYYLVRRNKFSTFVIPNEGGIKVENIPEGLGEQEDNNEDEVHNIPDLIWILIWIMIFYVSYLGRICNE